MTVGKNVDYDAVVIGAGFGGIRSLWELGKLGKTVKCYEAGSDVGGVWYWNRYPGARTDSEAWAYVMNFVADVQNSWGYRERYPAQEDVQQYLGRVADRFDLRKLIEFGTRVVSAHYHEGNNYWKITTANGSSVTCRYFLPATGPLSTTKEPPFPGLQSFTGKWYQTSKWPSEKIDFKGKRVAIVGTGATGVQIIPTIAPVAKQLTVFQRTANFVLPGRNYLINENDAAQIREQYDATWAHALTQPFGLAMTATGKTVNDVDAEQLGRILDAGWESGGFHYFFETLDDIFTNKDSNKAVSDYVRNKIKAIVKDQETAEALCPKHPLLSKRPPCGHFYYESFNRPNVQLVDISNNEIDLYETGIKTKSGDKYEFDIIIFALGFDAATGALSEIDVRGTQNKSLKETWANKLETYAGCLMPNFPNMFLVCGPHVPFGNMPVVVDVQLSWIGRTIEHMERNSLVRINASDKAVDAWQAHLDECFKATLLSDYAENANAWFVGANIPGKANDVLFYFGGVPNWVAWLNKESDAQWPNMEFTSAQDITQGEKINARI